MWAKTGRKSVDAVQGCIGSAGARNHESHWSVAALSIQRLEGSRWLSDLNGAEVR